MGPGSHPRHSRLCLGGCLGLRGARRPARGRSRDLVHGARRHGLRDRERARPRVSPRRHPGARRPRPYESKATSAKFALTVYDRSMRANAVRCRRGPRFSRGSRRWRRSFRDASGRPPRRRRPRRRPRSQRRRRRRRPCAEAASHPLLPPKSGGRAGRRVSGPSAAPSEPRATNPAPYPSCPIFIGTIIGWTSPRSFRTSSGARSRDATDEHHLDPGALREPIHRIEDVAHRRAVLASICRKGPTAGTYIAVKEFEPPVSFALSAPPARDEDVD